MEVRQRVGVRQIQAHVPHNVTIINRIKNLGYQLKQLAEQGIDEIYEYKNGAFNKIN